jgi:hypothetical protein
VLRHSPDEESEETPGRDPVAELPGLRQFAKAMMGVARYHPHGGHGAEHGGTLPPAAR